MRPASKTQQKVSCSTPIRHALIRTGVLMSKGRRRIEVWVFDGMTHPVGTDWVAFLPGLPASRGAVTGKIKHVVLASVRGSIKMGKAYGPTASDRALGWKMIYRG